MKKLFVFVLLVVSLLSVSSAHAQSLSELQALIAKLQAQIEALKKQQNTPTHFTQPVAQDCHTFTRDLGIGSTGADAVALQRFLESQGLLTMPAGVAKGAFDENTAAAVVKFQQKHGINATGYVGPLTRAKLNSLGCNESLLFSDVQLPAKILKVGTNVIYRYKVTAPNKDMSIQKELFGIKAEGVSFSDVALFGFVDANFTKPVPNYSGGRLQSPAFSIKNSEEFVITNSASGPAMPLIIAAGTTVYFELRANITGQIASNAIVVTNHKGLMDAVLYSSQYTPEPSISISITSSIDGKVSYDVTTVRVGDSIKILGAPQNIYLAGQQSVSRAFFFDPIFNSSCSNNGTDSKEWIMECKATKVGTSGFYVEMYVDGKTYRSNTITVKVVEGSPFIWTSQDTAASDSVEGQLLAQGKSWVRTDGLITAGSYVQDVLEGRFDQPRGRGAIAKVAYVITNSNGQSQAMADFGRGYSVPIFFSELSLIKIASDTTISVSASLVSASEDRAGTWGTFGPGKSSLGFSANDWKWMTQLTFGTSKAIKSMELIANNGMEGWSTKSGSNNPLRKDLYPLNVYWIKHDITGGDIQMTTNYNTFNAGAFEKGVTHIFHLYGQPESTTFGGGTLTIEFTDGTSVKATVPASTIRTVSMPIAVPVVDLITQYEKNSADAFVQAWIKADVNNKSLSHWKLSMSCAEGMELFGKNDENLCGKVLTLYPTNIFDAVTRENYTALTVGAKNTSSQTNSITLTLDAFDASGTRVGSDREMITLSPKVVIPSTPTTAPVTINSWTAPTSVRAGQSLSYSLNWSGGPTAERWRPFIHVVNADGSILFNDHFDAIPPTTEWSGDITTARTFTVPATAKPGTYRVMSGLYILGSTKTHVLSMATGVTKDSSYSGSRYQIGTITISSPTAQAYESQYANVLESMEYILSEIQTLIAR